MIVVDSSALVAVMRDEPETDDFVRAMVRAGTCFVSAVTLQETSMVLAGRNGDTASWAPLDRFIATPVFMVVPHDHSLAIAAREAFRLFGKGRHRASLNMGDCASYALAKTRDLPLLFKGGDFSLTDLIPAL